jgi:hypothetical protein
MTLSHATATVQILVRKGSLWQQRLSISGIRLLTQSFKFIYYQHWKVIDR